MGPREDAPRDATLAEALDALGSTTRLAVLRQLRSPKTLKEIRVRVDEDSPGPGLLSRQGVKPHLERLVEIGVVVARETEREYGHTVEYVVNHQVVYALSEAFRNLARLRPTAEPSAPTLDGAPARGGGAPKGPALVLVKGLDEGRFFSLDPPPSGTREWIIGRRLGLAVSLDFDPFVSSENTIVRWEDRAHWVMPVPSSRNGTLLNFETLASREELRPGDVIGVGASLLTFRSP